MPAKPSWISRIDEIIRQLEALPRPFVDRPTVEFVLGVGRRRAQQLLSPCVSRQVGSNGLADREQLIRHLETVVAGETAYYECQRRKHLATNLETLHRAVLERPQLLVEAPTSVMSQTLGGLPMGVSIGHGEIRVQFKNTTEALEKLLALAMAIGNDQQRFEEIAR